MVGSLVDNAVIFGNAQRYMRDSLPVAVRMPARRAARRATSGSAVEAMLSREPAFTVGGKPLPRWNSADFDLSVVFASSQHRVT